MSKPTCVLALILPSLALAGPLPGAQHAPPVFLDETQAIVSLTSAGGGYSFRAGVRVSGFSSKSDRLRLDWKSAGKLVGSSKCDVDSDVARHRAWGECRYDGAPLTATGAIEADLVYTDDQTDQDYLVRRYALTVNSWRELDNSRLYQVVADDLLGAGYARHGYTTAQDTEFHPEFVFWAETGELKRSEPTVLRCTVDGQKLPDFETFLGIVNGAGEIEAAHTPKSGPKALYHWEHISVTPKGLSVGERGANPHGARLMIDNPGHWDCMLRFAGKAIRELLFTVDEHGAIQPDEMQTFPTLPGIVLIDIRIPKDTGFDKRIRPDAMRKSMGFGLPWPDHPKVKQVQAAFPPATGSEI